MTDQIAPHSDLEWLVALPDSLLDRFPKNTQRAAWFAEEAVEYTMDRGTERTVTSGILRRLLQAGTDCDGHPGTVQRVMREVEGYGGVGVHLRDDENQLTLCLDLEAAKRLERIGEKYAEHPGGRR